MRGRLRKPGQDSNAALIATLAVAGLLAVPVLAAPGPELSCDDSKPALPGPTTFELRASPMNSGADNLRNHLLKPDARAAVRGAFAAEETAAEVVEDAELETDAEEASSDNGLHSASERRTQPYKRQMYRRDI